MSSDGIHNWGLTRCRKVHHTSSVTTLAALRQGETATLEKLDLPETFAHRLMQLGFIPGVLVEAAHQAPGGDPRVYRVDGSEIALRRETARQLFCTLISPAN